MCEGPPGRLGLPVTKQARVSLYCNGVGQAGCSCITPSSSRRGAAVPAGGSGLSRLCPTQGSCKSPAATTRRPGKVLGCVCGASPRSGTAGNSRSCRRRAAEAQARFPSHETSADPAGDLSAVQRSAAHVRQSAICIAWLYTACRRAHPQAALGADEEAQPVDDGDLRQRGGVEFFS